MALLFRLRKKKWRSFSGSEGARLVSGRSIESETATRGRGEGGLLRAFLLVGWWHAIGRKSAQKNPGTRNGVKDSLLQDDWSIPCYDARHWSTLCLSNSGSPAVTILLRVARLFFVHHR